MSTSSGDIAMDMNIGMCAKEGLFLLLFPFFTEYRLSPPSGSKGDIPK
ncbi:Gene model 904, (NCBI) [Apodemus speciosus]|uniref:Gene model 904, (NCBI) n=1 Tax=Apodemus speciosus TaxID=105296 RepID=A0ABQ0FG33_APOSI